MKIAYLLTQELGGLPHYTAELVNAVAENHDCYVLKPEKTTGDDMFSEDVTLVDCFAPMGVSNANVSTGNIDILQFLRGFFSYRNVNKLHDIDPDVVHITTYLLPQVRWFLHRYDIDEKYPIAVTFHNTDFNIIRGGPGTHMTTRIKNFLNLFAPDVDVDAAIVHRNGNAEDLIKEERYSLSEISVIPHGAFNHFATYDYEEKTTEEHTLLAFGNIVPAKSIETIIKAIPMIGEEVPDIKLIIAGEGKIPEKAMKIIDANPEWFELHNSYIPNNEVGTYFSRASLFVIPNRKQKGQSGTLTIAYSFGLPVVSTNVGPFPEMVGQKGTGLMVEPQQPAEMAEAVVQVLQDRSLYDRMAENARAMSEEISWSNIAKEHIETYERIATKMKYENQ